MTEIYWKHLIEIYLGHMMLSLVNLDLFTTILGGWVGGWMGLSQKIENKVHLSPAEAEIGAELGNNK